MPTTSVLFICEGNICRSPMGEMAWAALSPELPPAHSAGLRAVVESPIHPRAYDALKQRAIPHAPEFRARQATPPMTRNALILTMTSEQRATIAAFSPATYPRTFTLREMAALTQRYPAASLGELHRLRRGQVIDPSFDIADPIGKDAEYFTSTLDAILEAIRTLSQLPREFFD